MVFKAFSKVPEVRLWNLLPSCIIIQDSVSYLIESETWRRYVTSGPICSEKASHIMVRVIECAFANVRVRVKCFLQFMNYFLVVENIDAFRFLLN